MQPNVISESTYELTYSYGADYNRMKSVLKNAATVVNTRYYFSDGFEKEVMSSGTRYIQYIASPAGLAAIIVSNGGSHTTHYTYTDHLGSIVTVTNSAGAVEAQQSFDAWGRRRAYDTWTPLAPTATVPGIPDWLYRGYTGHEHMDQFGLINMNGRMYDPVLGRMLSPDNYINDAGFSQDYNRYSYARNNPLVYTDPDGNNPIIGAIIGAASYTLGIAFSKGGFKNWDWFGFLSSTVIGAMTSGFATELGGALSAAVDLHSISAFAAGAIQVGAYGAWGGATSYFSSMGAKGSFLSGALTGAGGSAVGSLTGGLNPALQVGSSAAFGGIVSELSGGNFWNGAAQAGIIAGFNHAAHRILDLTVAFNKQLERTKQVFESRRTYYEKLSQLAADISPEAVQANEASRMNEFYELVKTGSPYDIKNLKGSKFSNGYIGKRPAMFREGTEKVTHL